MLVYYNILVYNKKQSVYGDHCMFTEQRLEGAKVKTCRARCKFKENMLVWHKFNWIIKYSGLSDAPGKGRTGAMKFFSRSHGWHRPGILYLQVQ